MEKGRSYGDLLGKIKEAVNIVDVVSEHVVLRKAGSNYTGLCPFHSERSPSFSVSEQKQLYHCYGCKAGGDAVKFVQELHGLSFPEALEELAERSRIPLPQEFRSGPGGGAQDAAEREKKALAYKVNRFAAAFYRNSLPGFAAARDYLKNRHMSADLEQLFYVGGAPDGWEALVRRLQDGKAPLDVASQLGLIQKSTARARPGGPGYFDLFRNRVVFPILDLRGKVAGFGGRILPGAEDAGGTPPPKYLNSPESLVFQKSRLAFGLFQAQKHIRESGEVVLVEGYFDVMALHQAGFGNVVAACGTSITPQHLQLFGRLGDKITVLFDGDEAGINAMTRAMETGLAAGRVLHGAFLPEELDPDELLERPDGKARMTELLAASRPLLDLQMEKTAAKAKQGGAEELSQALKTIGRWLAMFQDAVGREVRMDWVCRELGVDRRLVLQAMGGAPAGPIAQRATPAQTAPRGQPGKPTQPPSGTSRNVPTPPVVRRARVRKGREMVDRTLVQGLVLSPRYAQEFDRARSTLSPGAGIPDLFEEGPAKAFATAFPRGVESALAEVTDPRLSALIREALFASDPPISAEDLQKALYRATQDYWARISQELRAALAEVESRKDADSQEKWKKLNTEFLDVQRKLKEPGPSYE